ncbi:glutathione gamma-glutamylcysteinyltransferase [Entomortierella parvispora]|uniref:glutathione gamma-glutamylcysteinyltransferase n=1 Tax=Entomortierella parvispora TaxID=205924 RepID=A0A9P3HG92_9FUNG|nr:glutathione gamma-glutamylcysteinyltransferase [Entomortierella parvispora]
MQAIPEDAFSNVLLLRPPSRENQFSVIATADFTRADDPSPSRVFIHQSPEHHKANDRQHDPSHLHQHSHHNHNHFPGPGLRQNFSTWHHIIKNASVTLSNPSGDPVQEDGGDQCWPDQQPSYLVPILGQVDFESQSRSSSSSSTLSGAIRIKPGSFASKNRTHAPALVMDYYPRGTLRQALDRGDFLKAPTTPTTSLLEKKERPSSDWRAKLVVLKDMAQALHFIQIKMLGQQHGRLSSDSIYLGEDGHAFLAWHPFKNRQSDFLSGQVEACRWFAPDILRTLADKLKSASTSASSSTHKESSTSSNTHASDKTMELDQDDMYSFGMLAWEMATDELPFGQIVDAIPSKLVGGARFKGTPPLSLLRLIHQWTDLDRMKRPSWCTIVSQLDSLDPDSLSHEIDMLGKGLSSTPVKTELLTAAHTPTSQPTAVPPPPKQQQQQADKDKSQVVDMMESVLDSTFYRRDLPSHLDSLTSMEGRRLFREMVVQGTAESFFPLCTAFNTQSDPAFCGVSSLSMVLNALSIDPRKQWKGVWRWYSDEQLDCCASLEIMRQKGITFNQFACLARCHAKVVVKRADKHTLEEFRKDVESVSQSDNIHMVLSFSRSALGQTGSGHFSPVGGFHKETDKALIMDTARFKYPPFFATIQQLWESLLPEDPETGLRRGYFLITTTEKQRLDAQRKRLESMKISSPSSLAASAASSASSSTLSLPSLADSSESSDSKLKELLEATIGEGDASECDCECTKTK